MDITTNTNQLLFTTIRIEILKKSNKHGVATGFFLGYPHGDGSILFLVTNKHVIKESKEVKLHFIENKNDKPVLGSGIFVTLTDCEHIWYVSKNPKIDIAIVPLQPIYKMVMEKGNPFFRAIAPEFIPSVDDLEELDALEEVIFIGYPYGIWDTKNLLPIVRKGITATSIGLDFQGENQFLIDASVFPGSSGSPVFIYDKGFYTKKDGYTIPKNRLLFVGILSRVFYKKNKDDIEIISEPTIDTQESISKEFLDLGRVFNPLAINEVIESWLSEREEYANRFNEAVQTKKVI